MFGTPQSPRDRLIVELKKGIEDLEAGRIVLVGEPVMASAPQARELGFTNDSTAAFFGFAFRYSAHPVRQPVPQPVQLPKAEQAARPSPLPPPVAQPSAPLSVPQAPSTLAAPRATKLTDGAMHAMLKADGYHCTHCEFVTTSSTGMKKHFNRQHVE